MNNEKEKRKWKKTIRNKKEERYLRLLIYSARPGSRWERAVWPPPASSIFLAVEKMELKIPLQERRWFLRVLLRCFISPVMELRLALILMRNSIKCIIEKCKHPVLYGAKRESKILDATPLLEKSQMFSSASSVAMTTAGKMSGAGRPSLVFDKAQF